MALRLCLLFDLLTCLSGFLHHWRVSVWPNSKPWCSLQYENKVWYASCQMHWIQSNNAIVYFVCFLLFTFSNQQVLFLLGAFLDAIGGMGFDYVASGHYAKVVHPFADQMNESSVLELSQDMVPIWDTLLWLQDLVCICGL